MNGENTGELLKLEKLLDKTEYELKRKRTFQVLANADKYIDHLTKAFDIYYLISEELATSLYLQGLDKHRDIVRKTFKGMREQLDGLLKFILKQFDKASTELKYSARMKHKLSMEELATQEMLQSMPQTSMQLNLEIMHSSNTPKNQIKKNKSPNQKERQTPKKDKTFVTHSRKGSTSNHQRNDSLRKNTLKTESSPRNEAQKSDRHHEPTEKEKEKSISPPPEENLYLHPSHPKFKGQPQPVFQLTKEEQERLEKQEKELLREWKQREREREQVEALLKQRENIDSLKSHDITEQLREVLKGMEKAKKKVKKINEIGDGEDEEDDEPATLDYKEFTGEVLGAFGRAHKKAAVKMLKYIDEKGIEFFFKKDDAVKLVDKGTMVDP